MAMSGNEKLMEDCTETRNVPFADDGFFGTTLLLSSPPPFFRPTSEMKEVTPRPGLANRWTGLRGVLAGSIVLNHHLPGELLRSRRQEKAIRGGIDGEKQHREEPTTTNIIFKSIPL
jgi:hypothetical protein